MFSSQIYCVTFVNHRCTGGFTYFTLHFIHATFCIEPRSIVDGQIDYLFFFTDPMTLQPHDTDVKALTRLAGVENIVFCCNRSTADHIISSPLFMDPDYERTHPDYSSYTKRFENKSVVTEAVESVNKRKRKKR